jgi:hypothetical protein
VNAKVRKQLRAREQRIARRLERNDRQASARPELAATNIHYEIADRARAITTGGIGAVHLLVKRLDLNRAINDWLDLLKVHLPYHESDHVLNIAYTLLAGGTRLEHLDGRRQQADAPVSVLHVMPAEEATAEVEAVVVTGEAVWKVGTSASCNGFLRRDCRR